MYVIAVFFSMCWNINWDSGHNFFILDTFKLDSSDDSRSSAVSLCSWICSLNNKPEIGTQCHSVDPDRNKHFDKGQKKVRTIYILD